MYEIEGKKRNVVTDLEIDDDDDVFSTSTTFKLKYRKHDDDVYWQEQSWCKYISIFFYSTTNVYRSAAVKGYDVKNANTCNCSSLFGNNNFYMFLCV